MAKLRVNMPNAKAIVIVAPRKRVNQSSVTQNAARVHKRERGNAGNGADGET